MPNCGSRAHPAPLWYDFHLEPMRDVSGSTIGLTGAAVDITERKQGEAHLRLLLRELTHRSKNLLAVIQAMARQTAKHGGTVQAFVERFGERVQALARSHDLLVAESWRSASLYDLVRSQLAFYIDREPDSIVIEGPDIKLRPEAAQSLGLALHELATNAVAPRRHVEIRRTCEHFMARAAATNDGFELLWRESGGPKVTAPEAARLRQHGDRAQSGAGAGCRCQPRFCHRGRHLPHSGAAQPARRA